MVTNNAHNRRRSMRHPGHSYSEPGAYFVTICVQDRRCLLGFVDDGTMKLSPSGTVIEHTWDGLTQRFPSVLFDAFVVVPNHVHGVVILGGIPDCENCAEGAMNRAATNDGYMGAPEVGDQRAHRIVGLGEVVRALKAVSTSSIRSSIDATFAWQSDYHDRIIRSERELATVRE